MSKKLRIKKVVILLSSQHMNEYRYLLIPQFWIQIRIKVIRIRKFKE